MSTNNAIPTRIASFLKNYPPFSLLDKTTILQLSEQVVVKFVKAGDTIFLQGQTPPPCIYMVREGAVHLYREEEQGEQLVDECDEGDLFGIRPLLADDVYLLTAKAAEETLLLTFQLEQVKTVAADEPRVAWFMAQNFAAGVRNRMNAGRKGRIFHSSSSNAFSTHLEEVQTIVTSKSPVYCYPELSVQEAALTMRERKVGSILIVNKALHPIGIITDRDLRNQVTTGDHSLATPVKEIMSSPVRCIQVGATVAAVQLMMMRHRIHHLCVTEDGTDQTPVEGVVSEHDLLVLQANNPAIMVREMRRCRTAEGLQNVRNKAEQLLQKYLDQEVSINFIANIMTAINDALIDRAIELGTQQLHATTDYRPSANFCWLALGSEGRGEQLLRTDQDNALVFADVPEEDYQATKEYYLTLAKNVTAILHHAGFAYCPGDMMASNPQWCMSLSEWKEQFTEWITTPTEKNIMYCSIFFDFRPVYGVLSFGDALTEHIYDLLDKESRFFAFMAKNAIQKPPPLTFFRNFVVEKSGEHADQFDIKARAMMPLVDVARTLILKARVPRINNTFQRFDHLAQLEPLNKELFEQAADAYEILIRYRARAGLRNNDSGRYISPEELTKMERLNLRNSFQPIRSLQDILKVRFRLALIS